MMQITVGIPLLNHYYKFTVSHHLFNHDALVVFLVYSV